MSDIRPLTHQEIFDTIWNDYVEGEYQISLKSNSSTTCVYRGPEGKRCFIGRFIPDHDYNPIWERKGGIRDLIADNSFVGSETAFLLSESYEDFLGELQDTHDLGSDKDDVKSYWRRELSSIAQDWNLTIPGGNNE
jgi:hypothetical protein